MALPAFAVLAADALLLSACAGASSQGSRDSAAAQSSRTSQSDTVAATSASVAPVKLHLDEGSRSVDSATAIVRGTVTRGARVTVNGMPAHVEATRWQRVVHLHLGRNRVMVSATLAGAGGARRTIAIVRERSVAEIERRRRLHEAAARRRAAKEAEARAAKEAEAAEEASSPSTPSTGECTNGTYVNSAGNVVCRPEEAASPPAGATAECADGTYSFSQSRSGTCSSHGGVKRWL